MALAADGDGDGDGDDACCYYFHLFSLFSHVFTILFYISRMETTLRKTLAALCPLRPWQDAYGQRSDAAASESVLARICKPSNQL